MRMDVSFIRGGSLSSYRVRYFADLRSSVKIEAQWKMGARKKGRDILFGISFFSFVQVSFPTIPPSTPLHSSFTITKHPFKRRPWVGYMEITLPTSNLTREAFTSGSRHMVPSIPCIAPLPRNPSAWSRVGISEAANHQGKACTESECE